MEEPPGEAAAVLLFVQRPGPPSTDPRDLTGQLAPDFKTIADFRKDNGKAIREVCRAFVALCQLVPSCLDL